MKHILFYIVLYMPGIMYIYLNEHINIAILYIILGFLWGWFVYDLEKLIKEW